MVSIFFLPFLSFFFFSLPRWQMIPAATTNRIRIWNVMYHHLRNKALARCRDTFYTSIYLLRLFSLAASLQDFMHFRIQFPRNIKRRARYIPGFHLLYFNVGTFSHICDRNPPPRTPWTFPVKINISFRPTFFASKFYRVTRRHFYNT